MKIHSQIQHKSVQIIDTYPHNRSIEPEDEFLVVTAVTVPPDGGYAWVVLCASFFNNILLGFYYTFPLVLSHISDNHSIPFKNLACSMGLAGLSFNISGIFTCGLLNCCGYRIGNILGTILTFFSFIILAFSHNTVAIYIFHGLLSGIGFGIMNLSSMLAVNHYFQRWRLLASIISGAGACFGGVLCPLIFYFYHLKYSQEMKCKLYLLISSGIITVVGGLASLFFIPLKTEICMVPDELKYFNESIISLSSRKPLDSLQRQISYIKPEVQRSFLSRSLTRSDIFYSPKMSKNKLYTESQGRNSVESNAIKALYASNNMAVSRIDIVKNVKKKGCQCYPTLKYACWNIFYTMRAISLMKNLKYSLLLISAFFTAAGMLSFITFIYDHIITKGFAYKQGILCFGCIGLSNMLGRLIVGILMTLEHCNGLWIYTISVIVIAIDLSLIDYWLKPIHYILTSALFGFFIAPVYVVYTDIIVEYIGLEKLTIGFNHLLLFFGIGQFVGVLICGLVSVATDNNMKIRLPGIYFLISSIICIILCIIELYTYVKHR